MKGLRVLTLVVLVLLYVTVDAKPRADQHKQKQHEVLRGSRHHDRAQSHHLSAKAKATEMNVHRQQEDFMRDEHLLHVIPPMNAAEKRLHAERDADRHLKDVVQRVVARKATNKSEGKQKNKKAIVNKKTNLVKKRKLNKKARDFNAKPSVVATKETKTKQVRDFKGKKAANKKMNWKKAARKALRMHREGEDNKKKNKPFVVKKKALNPKDKIKRKLRTKREKKMRKMAAKE